MRRPASHGAEPLCQACAGPWDLRRGALHHRSYARLGHELDSDLSPLGRPCHRQLHRILEPGPVWLWLGREPASDAVIARMRALKSGQYG